MRERKGIGRSRPSVRRILAKAGIGSPRSRRAQQHRVRGQLMPKGQQHLIAPPRVRSLWEDVQQAKFKGL